MLLSRSVRMCTFALAASAGPALGQSPDRPQPTPPSVAERMLAAPERAEPGLVQSFFSGLALFAADRLFTEPDVSRRESWKGLPGPSVGLNF